MSKFRRLYERLCQEGIINQDASNLFTPDIAKLEDFIDTHCLNYLKDLFANTTCPKAWRRVGLPWSEGLIERTLTAPNGTLLTAQLALTHGLACHLAGGTHHAHWDFGSGFCLINDLAYAAQTLIRNQKAQRILIFDCDVHQGDGTAAILKNHPYIFTCSIHCEKNFPFRKTHSDLDIGLPLHLSDKTYLDTVEKTLEQILHQFDPDLVLYDAGVDVWEHDPLGRLAISWEGIALRDRVVLEMCLDRGTPIATVIGGGYDQDHERLAQRHAIVIEQAHSLIRQS